MQTKTLVAAAAAVITAAATALIGGSAANAGPSAPAVAALDTRYVVLVADGASRADALAAVARAGGRVVGANAAIGALTVQAPRAGFSTAVDRERALAGAARDRIIGRVPDAAARPDVNAEPEALARAAAARARAAGRVGTTIVPRRRPGTAAAAAEPLAGLQWNMRMVKADQAQLTSKGNRRVLVGILDSGIDASHPDLAGQVDLALSRNFASDIPVFDGPCEFAGCVDPVGVDNNGHGTHVAGIVAAAANGIGLSGVAPNVTLVQIRGGQDAGLVFLNPVISALTYAADTGLDIVNMSFFIDPWLFNCRSNPADSPEEQAEQRATITAVSRAMNYAHRKNVTLIDSLGNENLDHGNPPIDDGSPNPGTPHARTIDPADCFSLPVEGPHSIGVAALGPGGRKADYSNHGLEQNSVSGPGGWFRDGFGTPTFRTNGNLVLSTYPLARLQQLGLVDAAGNVVPAADPAVFKSCAADGVTCGYYRYLQGTSMAAPHAAGVAALAISRFGRRDPAHPGQLTLAPDRVERILTSSAVNQACPASGGETYTNEGRGPEFDAPCVGTFNRNSLYGDGIIDALAVVTGPFSG